MLILLTQEICLSLKYNVGNSFLYANGVKIYYFKAKHPETIQCPLFLGYISKYFTVDNMNKIGLNGKV